MTSAPVTQLPTPESVLQFLQQNPGFLQEYPELVSSLSDDTRNAGGTVVDFQQMMVQKLRSDKQRVEDRTRTLVDNVRTNMTIQARVHAGVVRLLESETLEELCEMIASELSLMLEVDVISVLIEAPEDSIDGVRCIPARFIDNHMGPDRDSWLQANVPGDPRIYGPAARLVKSQALLRLTLGQNMPDALLAFGSRDPLLFADGQGTELLAFLGDVIERLLRRHLVPAGNHAEGR